VEFLKVVVIELEKIKIEEEKMKEVLDWLISKEIKNIQKFLKLPIIISGLLKILCL